MRYLHSKKAAGGNQAALNISTQYRDNYTEANKRKPAYFRELLNYPQISPIMIAVEWEYANYIRRHKGTCLVCDGHSQQYDFPFCRGREIWVLFTCREDFIAALELGREIQLYGAQKVICIRAGSMNGGAAWK